MRRFLIGLLLLLTWSISAHAEDRKITKTELPTWVSILDIPDPNPKRLTQAYKGLYYLVSDIQEKWDGKKTTLYSRLSFKVVDRSGLEKAANVKVTFLPGFEKLSFHSITIWRDGKKLDRLQSQKFKIFQRETELDAGILNGRLTAFTSIKDVRVGDVVEWSYSMEIRPRVLVDHFSTSIKAEYSVPLGIRRYRVLLPEKYSLIIKNKATNIKPSEVVRNQQRIYEWKIVDGEPILGEDQVPGSRIKWGKVYVSTLNQWSDVVDDMNQHYKLSETLPKAFAAKIDNIAKLGKSDDERAGMIVRLVQDSIRYVGIEIGFGAFVPRSPELVIERGFGDCKDKSLLLASALKRIGVPAVVALAHLSRGKAIQSKPVSPHAFNHAIVRVDLNGKTYWVDPTSSHQGGRLSQMSAPDYGYVLPLMGPFKGLEKIPTDDLKSKPTMVIREIYQFHNKGKNGLTLTSKTVYTGAEADAQRLKFANSSVSDIGKNYFDYYEKAYPGLETKSQMTIQDDRSSNQFIINEVYFLSAEKLKDDKLYKDFMFSGDAVRDVIKAPKGNERRLPISIVYPIHREHFVDVLDPPVVLRGPDNLSIKNAIVDYRFTSTKKEKNLHLHWVIKTLTAEISPDKFQSLKTLEKKVTDSSRWWWNFYPEKSKDTSKDKAETKNDDEEELSAEDWLVAVAFFMGITLPVVGSIWWGLRADGAYRANGYFFPISPVKFSLMTFATFGLYPAFYFWKFWLWDKQFNKKDTWPFWRMFFYPYFVLVAFLRVRDQKDSTVGWEKSVGILAQIAIVPLVYASTRISLKYDLPFGYDLTFVVVEIAVLLPLVFLVNRLNIEKREVYDINSSYNAWNVVGIFFGLACWLFVADVVSLN